MASSNLFNVIRKNSPIKPPTSTPSIGSVPQLNYTAPSVNGSSVGGGGNVSSAPASTTSPSYQPQQQLQQASYAVPQITVAQMPSIQQQPVNTRMAMQPSFEVSEPQYEEVSAEAPVGLANSSGMMSRPEKTTSIDEVLYEAMTPRLESGLDAWEKERAKAEGRQARTENYWGERYSNYDENGGLADNQLEIGNTAINDAYIRDAIANGLSEDDAYDIMHTERPVIGINAGGDPTALDDGSAYDYDHMTADNMTGTQYLKYAEMGMGGRPIEQIDPLKVYSKRREQVNHGFTPFTPDDRSYANMVADNLLDVPGRLGMWVSDLRNVLSPDYTINIGDKKLSGKDYDKLVEAYMHQYQRNEEFKPETYLSPGENSTPIVREYEIPDANGNTTYHYGSVVRDKDGNSVLANDDGTYKIKFSDNTTVNIDQDYLDSIMEKGITDSGLVRVDQARGNVPKNLESMNQDVKTLKAMADEYGGTPLDYADVLFLPDLIMSDGTHVPMQDVQRLWYDQTSENDKEAKESKRRGIHDDDISYEFSSGILPYTDNKPSRFIKHELFGENGGFDDLADNVWDWTLGSLPISIGKNLPWINAASNATSSMVGADPSQYNVNTDSYGMIAGNYDKNGNMRYGVYDKDGKRNDELSESTRFWNTVGNAAVPLTEMVAGPIGEQIVPIEKLSDKLFGKIARDASGRLIAPTAGQVLRNMGVGAIGEGIEEIIGNFFDDLTQYGPTGLFANQEVDENGQPMYDVAGHEIRDYDTPIEDRFRNAVNPTDWLNAFAGGVGVDTLMQMMPGVGQLWQLPSAVRRDIARHKTGVKPFIEPEERERKEVSSSLLEGFRD